MLRHTQFVILILLMSSLAVSSELVDQGDLLSITSPPSHESDLSWHIADDPIRVRNNSELAALASYGAGTENDPYLITNIQISAFEEEVIFEIWNTDAYFRLINCQVYVERGWASICLVNVTNGVIEECEITGAGFILDRSNHCEIVDCTISKAESECGIEIWLSEDVKMIGNTISNSPKGISFIGCEDIWIESNHIFNCAFVGIDIYLSGNTTLRDNILENNGVFLSLWWAGYNGHSIEGSQYIDVPYNFENNIVNGKPLGFFHEVSYSSIDGAAFGQVILLNCTDVEVTGGNLSNASVGYQIHFSQDCTIRGAIFANNTAWGMYSFNSENTTVMNCDVQHNKRDGVFLEYSNCSLIYNNSITDNEEHGLGLHSSNGCIILNNTLSRNNIGVNFYSSNECFMVGNEILHNSMVGIYVTDGSSQNTIYGNAIGWNDYANARDEAGYNFWDDGNNQGNSWSDYSGFGEYLIDYYGVDHYPSLLSNPMMNPVNLVIIGVGSTVLIIAIFSVFKFKQRKFQ
jgi:parallel beta-helix repeat protein